MSFALDDYNIEGHYEIYLVISGTRKGGIPTMNHRKTMKHYYINEGDKRASTINKALRLLIYQTGSEKFYLIQ